MTALALSLPANDSSDPLHDDFLALLPKLQTHARIYFRHIVCPDKKADKIAETTALAWKWYRRLAERGKDVSKFPMAFISLVARAVKSGRRACGMEKAKDVMSPLAQQRRGFKVEALPSNTHRCYESIYSVVQGQQELDAYEERLHDNAQTPVPDQAAFRLDFPRFLGKLSHRDRQLAMYLSLGHSGKTAASKFGISAGRVTQIRQQMCKEWRIGQGEEETGSQERAVAVT